MSTNAVSGTADPTIDVSSASVISSVKPQVTIAPGPSYNEFTIPLMIALKSGTPVQRVDLRQSLVLQAMLMPYETVDLVSWRNTVTVYRSEKTWAAVAFDQVNQTYKDGLVLYAPLASYISSSTNGMTVENFDLPLSHPFGRRIKGLNLSTKLPALFTNNSTSTAMVGHIRSVVVVRAFGLSPISAVAFADNSFSKQLDNLKQAFDSLTADTDSDDEALPEGSASQAAPAVTAPATPSRYR